MKRRLLLALAGLAIGCAAPGFAQENNPADRYVVQQRDLLGVADALAKFHELNHKLEAAYDQNDAPAVAALFTVDGVLVTGDGVFRGRQRVEERYARGFRRSPVSDFICSRECYNLQAIDNAVWATGEWANAFQGQTGPAFARGYWSAIYVPEGEVWKIRLLSLTEYSPLPPKATPSSQ